MYKYDNTIDWDTLYKETLKNKRISIEDRGYEPAIELKSLADRINSFFYDNEGTYNETLKIAYDLTYFTRNRAGSCNDCGTFEVLPYFKRVFLQYFVNTLEYPERLRLCTDLLNIFTGKAPHYIDELAVLDFPFKQPDKRIMVDVVETSFNVAFYCPYRLVW